MSSAFLQTSVYHWAKSTSRAVMASTCLLSCAIVSILFSMIAPFLSAVIH